MIWTFNDPHRSNRIQAEIEFLAQELTYDPTKGILFCLPLTARRDAEKIATPLATENMEKPLTILLGSRGGCAEGAIDDRSQSH